MGGRRSAGANGGSSSSATAGTSAPIPNEESSKRPRVEPSESTAAAPVPTSIKPLPTLQGGLPSAARIAIVCRHAGKSEDEARAALEACDWDVDETFVYLAHLAEQEQENGEGLHVGDDENDDEEEVTVRGSL